MRRTLPILLLTLLAFALAACGGDDDDGGASKALDIFFAPENADALAHASLPDASDLPDGAWEVTAQDDFGENDQGLDFAAFAASEPACAQMSALANVGGIFGSDEEELPAGRAKIEFENAQSEGLLPDSVEVEVEIEETVSEVEGAWDLVKEIFESDETEACMLAVFNEAFGEAAQGGDLEIEVAARDASSTAPNNGASMAFDINMDLAGIELDLSMEMYLWPYGNAKVTVQFMGSQESLNSDLTGPTLDAIVDKLDSAAAVSEG
jgi:hypothetical protein